jgi:hypothetical protein
MGAQGGSSLVNAVNHSRGHGSHGGFGRRGYSRGNGGRESSPNEGNRGGRFSGRRGGYNSSSDKCPLCQLCKKKGHMADRCWHMFDEDYVPEERMAAAATGYGHDNSWYTDSGATDHVTCDLEKLAIQDNYTGNDQIHTVSGSCMKINHIGHSIIHTPCCQLQLNNILHVPQASKNLVSVHCLASDNIVFLEFHPRFICIKDLDSRNIILKGPCQEGLYPLPAAFKKLVFGINKMAGGAIRLSIDRWHSRLGHPAMPTVQRVIREFDLPCLVKEE